MKTIVLCKPFGKIKSYSVCLDDKETSTRTPILYIQPSSFLSEEEYHTIMKELRISCRQDYLPKLKETTDEKN